MTTLQVFTNPVFGEVRTTTHNGEIAFVAKDIAEKLGIDVSNVGDRIAHVPDEWKGRGQIATPGGTQEMWLLTEQGLYFFLARSDKPLALPFQKWIAGEVLPSIRKTGGYSVSPSTIESLQTRLQLAETWKPDYNGFYDVSDLGKVRNAKTKKVFKPSLNNSGYVFATLHLEGRKSCAVHRLVAMAFLQNHRNFPTVNHVNGIKTDNRVENLEWYTRSENQIHATKIGLRNQAKRVVDDKGNVYASTGEAGRSLGIGIGHISAVCRGELRHFKGHRFSYVDEPLDPQVGGPITVADYNGVEKEIE